MMGIYMSHLLAIYQCFWITISKIRNIFTRYSNIILDIYIYIKNFLHWKWNCLTRKLLFGGHQRRDAVNPLPPRWGSCSGEARAKGWGGGQHETGGPGDRQFENTQRLFPVRALWKQNKGSQLRNKTREVNCKTKKSIAKQDTVNCKTKQGKSIAKQKSQLQNKTRVVNCSS